MPEYRWYVPGHVMIFAILSVGVVDAAFVSTLVGGASSGVQGQDGLASNVFFSSVHGVALDSRGGLYITDQTDCIIRYLSSSGVFMCC